MKTHTHINLKQRHHKAMRILREIRRDESGVAAIEFAFVAPIILFLMMSSMAVFDVYNGTVSIERGATTIVDLVTRQGDMTDDRFDLMVGTSESLIGHYSNSEDFQVTITSIVNEFDSDADTSLSVGWMKSNVEIEPLEDEDLVHLEFPAIPEGGSIIMVNIRSSYTPYFTTSAFDLFKYNRTVMRRPRFVDKLGYLEES